MSDQQIIEQAISDYASGYPISDLQARVIANGWHGGQASALYSFVSTGNTADAEDSSDTLVAEIEHEIAGLRDEPEAEELHALLAYVTRSGARGPQEGWSDLSW